jgi:hypothetical protein
MRHAPDERRRQIVVCPPVYAAGLAISPCGAESILHDTFFSIRRTKRNALPFKMSRRIHQSTRQP